MRKKDQELRDEFIQFVTQRQQEFYRLAFRYTHDQDGAMDVVQEALEKALRALPSLRQPEYMKTWFYRILAGVKVDESAPGYKRVIIKPTLPQKLSEVYYSNMTPYGKLVSEVRQNIGSLELNVSIPVGSEAMIYIPVYHSDPKITESGKTLDSGSGIEVLGLEHNYCKVKVGQGVYRFLVKE